MSSNSDSAEVGNRSPDEGARPTPPPSASGASRQKRSHHVSTAGDGGGGGGATAPKRARPIIGAATMGVLLSSYNLHFSNYCKGRKQVVQKVPSKVWQSVWADFIAVRKQEAIKQGIEFCEDELPVQRTLQDAIRSTLDDQETTDQTCEEHQRNQALLNEIEIENVLDRPKRSDLSSRPKPAVELVKSAGSGNDAVRPASDSVESSGNGRSPVQRDLLARIADSIDRFVDVIDSRSLSISQAMADQAKILREGLALRNSEFDQKQARDEEEVLDLKLKRLILLRDNGVLSDEDFKRKAKHMAAL